MHIELSSASQPGKHVEEGVLSVLKKVISMISLKDLPDGLSDDQRNRAAFLLKELQTVIIGAQLVRSILLFAYMPTCQVLQSVNVMFVSGELAGIFQQLFRCLTGIEDLTVAISIKAEALQQCKDDLSFVGMSLCGIVYAYNYMYLCCFNNRVIVKMQQKTFPQK